MKTNNYTSVPHREYDKKYFLTDCGGYSYFIKYHGLKIDERMSKSLKLANVEPGMNVLDIGSGRGEIVLQCALKKAEAIGIDYSLDAIKMAFELKKRYETLGNKMSFLRGSATRLPLKNGTFDRIFLLDLVEHLHEPELNNLFKDLNSILKEDGIIIIHTAPNKLYYEYGYNIIRIILYLLKGIKIENDIRSGYEKNMHVNEQTPKSLDNLLKRNGFDSQIRLYDTSHPDLLIKKHFTSLLSTVLSITNMRFFSKLFCRDIYAIAWKHSKSNYFINYVTNVINELGKVHETEYMPRSKEFVIKEILTDCIVMGKNDLGVLDNGWYSCENWPPTIRWMGKKAKAYLKAGGYHGKLFIKATTSFPDIKGQILINKKQVRSFEIRDCEWKILEVNLPYFYKNDIIELEIELNKTWIPNEIMKNGDTRELGIAVHKIWIE